MNIFRKWSQKRWLKYIEVEELWFHCALERNENFGVMRRRLWNLDGVERLETDNGYRNPTRVEMSDGWTFLAGDDSNLESIVKCAVNVLGRLREKRLLADPK